MVVVLSVSLVGGPPWGFRVRQNDGEAPSVSQVVFEGRAYAEGVRANDIIENVDDEECTSADQVHARMRNAQGVLRLRLKRLSLSSVISELSDASDKTPTMDTRRQSLEEDLSPNSSNFSKPPLPIYAQTNDENYAINFGYNGGSRGSAHDKKKYFEQLAMKQTSDWTEPQTDRSFEKKILLGNKQPPLPSDQSSLSGYDSVSADFAGFRTTDSSDRQTPVSSIDPMDDLYTTAAGYDLRNASWLPLATLPEEIIQTTNERHIYDKNLSPRSQITDEMVHNIKLKSIPPPTLPKPKTKPQTTEPTWRIRSTDRHGSIITTPMTPNKISNGVEVPRPQSVAQLRKQMTSRLEMKTPSGSRPMSPAMVHQPIQPHSISITPQPFGRTYGRNYESQISLSSETPYSTTSNNTSATTSPHMDNYHYHYDEMDLPVKYGTLPSSISLGSSTLDTGYSSAPSTLKRQHSQVFSSPEIQYPILINRNGASNADLIFSNSYPPNNNAASDDTLKDLRENFPSNGAVWNDFILSETGAPFSIKPPPIPVDGSMYMLGETISPNNSRLSPSRDLEDSPTLALDYSPLDSIINGVEEPRTPKSHTVPPSQHTKTPNFSNISSQVNSLTELSGVRQQNGSQDSNNLFDFTYRFSTESTNNNGKPLLSEKSNDQLTSSSYVDRLGIGNSNGVDYSTSQKRYYENQSRPTEWHTYNNFQNGNDQEEILLNHQDLSTSMTSTSQFRDDNQSRSNTDSLQRRSKSVGNHIELTTTADKWRENERQAASIESSSKTALDALYEQCTNPATTSSCCSHKYGIQAKNETKHFHLPSYRFVHEDARPILSSRKCLRCWRQRRDYTWHEIEHLYALLDKNSMEKEAKTEELGQKIKHMHIQNRLEVTTNELQKLIDNLEVFSTARSKSTPEFKTNISPTDRLAYLTRMQSSSNKQGALQNGTTILSGGINELKKITMDEMLQRQRVEKLSEELEEQNNRRHHYVPNAAPALQNNLTRFDHLLYNDVDHRSSRASTPKRSTTQPIQTATVLYKFVAQTSRELSLNRGDVVKIHRELDSNWYEGTRAYIINPI